MIEDSILVTRMGDIYEAESLLTDDDEVILITWSPNPKDLPDADFRYQHLFNVNLLSDFLKVVKKGCFCVEATLDGNPHYHGWYVKNPDSEKLRLVFISTFKKVGNLKQTKCRSIRTLRYSSPRNGLYYYKKELASYACYPHSVILSTTRDDTDWNYKNFFDKSATGTVNVTDKITDRQFYLQFYADSD